MTARRPDPSFVRQHMPAVLGFLALALVPHLSRLPLAVLAWCLLAFTLAFFKARQGASRPSPSELTILSFAALLATVFSAASAPSQVILASALAAVLGLKALESRCRRDLAITLFLGLFLVLSNLFFSESPATAAYCILAAGAFFAVLARLNHAMETGFGRLRQSAVILMQALPLAILLFLVFPRLPGGFFGLAETSPADRFPESLSQDDFFEMTLKNDPAFRVTFQGEPPAKASLYWRGLTLTRFDGALWTQDPALPNLPQQRSAWDLEYVPWPSRRLEYTVIFEANGERRLFALDLPAQAPRYTRLVLDYTLRTFRELSQASRYTLASHVPDAALFPSYREPADLRLMDFYWKQRALDLPAAGNPRARVLARSWQGLTPEAITLEALQYFHRGGFVYTLIPPPPGPEPIDDFLFDGKKGFCSHFAASYAFLLRAAGVPARIVLGYQGGEMHPSAGFLTVRKADAHAWVEVLLPNRGWTRVDPTAAVAPARIERGLAAALSPEELLKLLPGGALQGWEALRQFRDALDYRWKDWFLGYTFDRQVDLAARLGITLGAWSGPLALLGLTLLVTLAALYLGRFWASRPPAPAKADSTQQAYARLCQTLAAAGLPRAPDQGPLEYSRAVAAARPDLAESLRAVVGLYIRLRYAGQGQPGDAARLRDLARGFRAGPPPKSST